MSRTLRTAASSPSPICSTAIWSTATAWATGARFSLPLSDTHNAFVYVFEGSANLAGEGLATHTLAVLGSGDTVEIKAGTSGARFILVAGRPIGEPVVQHGPFVMNTRDEIEQAFADFQAGRLVRARATMTGD